MSGDALAIGISPKHKAIARANPKTTGRKYISCGSSEGSSDHEERSPRLSTPFCRTVRAEAVPSLDSSPSC